jgi:hypothetical protein
MPQVPAAGSAQVAVPLPGGFGQGVLHAEGPHVSGAALFAQTAPHLCVDPVQSKSQVPPLPHVGTPFVGAVQVLPQSPQWFGSFDVFVHTLPGHSVGVAGGQLLTQP